jgi:hypothetical protein
MNKLRFFLSALLSVAIIASGIPAQAGSGCPMVAHIQQAAKDTVSGKMCNGCTMTGKLESKKGGCCDDDTCTAKCFSLGVSASYILSAKADLPEFAAASVKFYTADGMIPSYLLQTQDRPPKHLS